MSSNEQAPGAGSQNSDPAGLASSTTGATDGWLLDDFLVGDVFFASPALQHRAWGAAGVVAAHTPATSEAIVSLFQQAEARGAEDAVLFGLVPFDASRPASLGIPLRYEARATPADKAQTRAHSERPNIVSRQPVPAPEVYGDMVRSALDVFAQGEVNKIVLSRAMDVTLDRPLDYGRVLPDLLARNAQGYTFAVPDWSGEGGAVAGVMVGASPELLVRREGDRIFVNPLAGSIGRHADPEIDEARRAGLAVSEKDLREHDYVVRDIVRILREHCDELDVPDGPSVIGTDALWHLSTFITGRVRNPEQTALELACALHPTPAICGFPTAGAFEQINRLEPFDRGYFTGLVGWQRKNGDGEWALTLRCARHDGAKQLRLYAGAGTVAGSVPESEITETATKMETFMRALA